VGSWEVGRRGRQWRKIGRDRYGAVIPRRVGKNTIRHKGHYFDEVGCEN